MPYKIYWSEKAYKQLKDFDKEFTRRIVKKIKSLEDEPFQRTQALSGCDFRRLRIGDWRVILEILPEVNKIKIILMRKQKNVYEELKQIRGKG